eukprot:7212439-Pyramimonas_sp.AAC.1
MPSISSFRELPSMLPISPPKGIASKGGNRSGTDFRSCEEEGSSPNPNSPPSPPKLRPNAVTSEEPPPPLGGGVEGEWKVSG